MNVDMNGQGSLTKMDFLMIMVARHVPDMVFGRSVPSSDDGDFKCNICGNEFRRYGNGRLHLGMIPRCTDCGRYYTEI